MVSVNGARLGMSRQWGYRAIRRRTELCKPAYNQQQTSGREAVRACVGDMGTACARRRVHAYKGHQPSSRCNGG